MPLRCVRLGLVGILTILTIATPRVTTAQTTASTLKNHLYDTFQVNLDFTTVLNRSTARVDGAAGPGTDLNFKEVFGISGTSIQPALGATWKPGKPTELQLGYQFLNQTGERLFASQVVIGDDTVDAGFNATTKINEGNATLQFRYSLFAAPKHSIGLAVGFGSIFFNLQLDATADGCTPSECQAGAVSIAKKLTGPTASLGAFGRWRVGDRWYVGGDLRGIGAKIDRFDVSVIEGAAFGRYFLSDRWGTEAGWNYTDVTLDAGPKDSSRAAGDFVGTLRYRYSSLKLGVVAAF